MTEGKKTQSAAAISAESHAIEAERAALGYLLSGNVAAGMDALANEGIDLQPSHFYMARHRLLYKIIRDMWDGGGYAAEGFDGAHVARELRRRQKLDEGEGDNYEPSTKLDSAFVRHDKVSLPYMASLCDIAGAPVNFPGYCRLIIEEAITRGVIYKFRDMQGEFADALRAGASSSAQEPVEVVLRHAFAMEDLLAQNGALSSFVSSAEAAEQFMADIVRGKASEPMVMTGLPTVDSILDGMKGGQVTIIGARPGVGKTAFACKVAGTAFRKFANEKGEETRPSVLFCSAEMTTKQLLVRFYSMFSGIDGRKLGSPRAAQLLTAEELTKLEETRKGFSELPLFIDDKANMTIPDIKASAYAAFRKGRESGNPLRLIVVDYLQIIENKKNSDPAMRWAAVAEMSRQIKALAKSLNVPILALAQVNRQQENRVEKTHNLSDLRESGNIEQDADVVGFLEAKENKTPADIKHVNLFIAKNRHGPAGMRIALLFSGSLNRFKEPPNHHENQDLLRLYSYDSSAPAEPSPPSPPPQAPPTEQDEADKSQPL